MNAAEVVHSSTLVGMVGLHQAAVRPLDGLARGTPAQTEESEGGGPLWIGAVLGRGRAGGLLQGGDPLQQVVDHTPGRLREPLGGPDPMDGKGNPNRQASLGLGSTQSLSQGATEAWQAAIKLLLQLGARIAPLGALVLQQAAQTAEDQRLAHPRRGSHSQFTPAGMASERLSPDLHPLGTDIPPEGRTRGLLVEQLLAQKSHFPAQGFVLGEQRVDVGGDLGSPGRRTGPAARIEPHPQSTRSAAAASCSRAR